MCGIGGSDTIFLVKPLAAIEETHVESGRISTDVWRVPIRAMGTLLAPIWPNAIVEEGGAYNWVGEGAYTMFDTTNSMDTDTLPKIRADSSLIWSIGAISRARLGQSTGRGRWLV